MAAYYYNYNNITTITDTPEFKDQSNDIFFFVGSLSFIGCVTCIFHYLKHKKREREHRRNNWIRNNLPIPMREDVAPPIHRLPQAKTSEDKEFVEVIDFGPRLPGENIYVEAKALDIERL